MEEECEESESEESEESELESEPESVIPPPKTDPSSSGTVPITVEKEPSEPAIAVNLDTSDEFVITDDITDPVMPTVKPLPVTQIKIASPLPKAKKMRKKRKLRKSPRKIKNFEADDYFEEDLDKLISTGIRTKGHTLDLSRRMIQATDFNTRLILCELLRKADDPCKRLFIDYRGLNTLGFWAMELGTWESGTDPKDLELDLMESVEDVLAVLTVPDKQVNHFIVLNTVLTR